MMHAWQNVCAYLHMRKGNNGRCHKAVSCQAKSCQIQNKTHKRVPGNLVLHLKGTFQQAQPPRVVQLKASPTEPAQGPHLCSPRGSCVLQGLPYKTRAWAWRLTALKSLYFPLWPSILQRSANTQLNTHLLGKLLAEKAVSCRAHPRHQHAQRCLRLPSIATVTFGSHALVR